MVQNSQIDAENIFEKATDLKFHYEVFENETLTSIEYSSILVNKELFEKYNYENMQYQ